MVQLVVSFPGPFRARQQRNIFYGTTYLATPKSPDFPPILHAKSGGNRQNPSNPGEDGLRVKVPIQAEFAARFTILLHVVCVPLGSVSVRASLSGRLRLGCGIGCLRQGERWMRCMECGSSAVSERSERTVQGYRRFRCRTCGKQFNERSTGLLNRTHYPSDVIALVVLWRLRYKLSLRDLTEMFL